MSVRGNMPSNKESRKAKQAAVDPSIVSKGKRKATSASGALPKATWSNDQNKKRVQPLYSPLRMAALQKVSGDNERDPLDDGASVASGGTNKSDGSEEPAEPGSAWFDPEAVGHTEAQINEHQRLVGIQLGFRVEAMAADAVLQNQQLAKLQQHINQQEQLLKNSSKIINMKAVVMLEQVDHTGIQEWI